MESRHLVPIKQSAYFLYCSYAGAEALSIEMPEQLSLRSPFKDDSDTKKRACYPSILRVIKTSRHMAEYVTLLSKPNFRSERQTTTDLMALTYRERLLFLIFQYV